MPNDLLRYLAGPTGYSAWWWLLVVLLLALLVGWYAGVIVWTLPPEVLRNNSIVGGFHRKVVARRFVRSVEEATAKYRVGSSSPAETCEAYTHVLRSFLTVATGRPAYTMQVAELENSPLAPAAPLIAALDDARFGLGRRTDVERIGADVVGVINSWP